MSELSDNPNLREINAYKKKINWGDIPTIYHLAMSSISDIDGILTHGFDSAFKQLLDRNNWNVDALNNDEISVDKIKLNNKPKISLYRNITEQHYELHCYPMINGERVLQPLYNNPLCSFIKWTPETMQILFRLNSLIPFIVYTLRQGDKADYALIRYADQRVEELIQLLGESFDIIGIKGYSIGEFCKEIYRKHIQPTDGDEKPDNMET